MSSGRRRRLCLRAIAVSTLSAGSLSVSVAGCGSSEPRVDTSLVRGQVYVDEQPADGAVLVFHPQSNDGLSQQLRPRGTADERGRFRLTTYQRDDGAPPGDYRVTVIWRGPPTSNDPEEMHPDVLAAQPNQLDAALADPKSTPITAHISRGNNKLEPFRLVRPVGGSSQKRIPGRK